MLYLSGAISREVAGAFEAPGVTSTVSAVLLGYTYVVLRRPRVRTAADLETMNAGFYWGLAVGCVWLTSITIEPAAIFLALFLPILGGAVGAVKTDKIRGGTYTGCWCGITGGLLGFLLWGSRSNLFALFPNLFSVTPDDDIVFAFLILVVYGLFFCPVAATIGGVIGVLLERTGRPPVSCSTSLSEKSSSI
jgi:hypothetical protein